MSLKWAHEWNPYPCIAKVNVWRYIVEVEATLRLTVGQSVCLGAGHPFGASDQILLFPFFCRKIALLFVLGRPLWWEDRSVICSAICQWSESWRTHNHILLSHLRLLGSLSISAYDSQGLGWKYSYSTPQREELYTSIYSPCIFYGMMLLLY
jgi:hypothetical protein